MKTILISILLAACVVEPPKPLECVWNNGQCDCDGVLGQRLESPEVCEPACLFDVASWLCYCGGLEVDAAHCTPPQPCEYTGAEDCECAGYPAPELLCQ